MKVVAIIPSAGAGVRMGGNRAKQFLDLCDRPLLAVTLEKFQKSAAVDSIIAVVPAGDLDFCQREIVERYDLSKVEKVVPGGRRRQDSVRIGIEASGGDHGLVLVHDGVRPLIQPGLIERVVNAATENRAVVAALPAKETVKEIDRDGFVVKTYDRRRVWLVQTPQAFRYGDILMAHRRALEEKWDGVTDDAFLMERAGIPVKVIQGSEENIKVTTPYDMEMARYLLENRT